MKFKKIIAGLMASTIALSTVGGVPVLADTSSEKTGDGTHAIPVEFEIESTYTLKFPATINLADGLERWSEPNEYGQSTKEPVDAEHPGNSGHLTFDVVAKGKIGAHEAVIVMPEQTKHYVDASAAEWASDDVMHAFYKENPGHVGGNVSIQTLKSQYGDKINLYVSSSTNGLLFANEHIDNTSNPDAAYYNEYNVNRVPMAWYELRDAYKSFYTRAIIKEEYPETIVDRFSDSHSESTVNACAYEIFYGIPKTSGRYTGNINFEFSKKTFEELITAVQIPESGI